MKNHEPDNELPEFFDPYAYELNPNLKECHVCTGSGEVFGITTPLVLTSIGIGLTWFGWGNIHTLVSPDSNARENDFIIMSCIGGLALVAYAWWKCLWLECDTCKGRGKLKDESDPSSAKPEPGTAGVIAEDQACHRCGYNTRSKCIGDACPECGTEILDRHAAEQYVESHKSLRVEIALGAIYCVGVVSMSLLFGSLGTIGFVATWILVWAGLKTLAYITRN